jgi:hypothetical protein
MVGGPPTKRDGRLLADFLGSLDPRIDRIDDAAAAAGACRAMGMTSWLARAEAVQAALGRDAGG